MNELNGEIPGKVKMKLGRRPKDQRKIYEINEDQTKFIMELANQKDHGREITSKGLAIGHEHFIKLKRY
jgi:hypothetical protein